eukprot:TRINITY_DN2938_c0_g3_i1.p1 TRINITY_DN2938_c0_g3~~TRINITY_DN2938_c0_g3_i1.p1  ORF type:complete len:320 (+),score=18.59 TRINITY_DN2938_c0_g3_i1:25-960(+)
MARVHTWLDVKFFYVMVNSCQGEAVPETLTVRYLPRSIGTELEMNGGRIPPSEHASVHLRRDRLDPDCAEVIYVSTDHVRTSGSVPFEILDADELLLVGALEYCDDASPGAADRAELSPLYDGFESSPRSPSKTVRSGWNIDCTCVLGSNGCSFTKGRHDYYSASAVTLAPPSMEICLVGRYLGPPVVLAQTVSLVSRRRNSMRRGTLDAIPEGDVLERSSVGLMLADQGGQVIESRGGVDYDEDSKVGGSLSYYSLDGLDNDDRHLSWFNTGVRVGVGLGLGMCIGLGLGVGLIVRSYQATTRTVRRRFF